MTEPGSRTMPMDWKDAAVAVSGFLGGLFASLLKSVMPGYVDLAKENRELRQENSTLRERVEGLTDALRDDDDQDEDERRRGA